MTLFLNVLPAHQRNADPLARRQSQWGCVGEDIFRGRRVPLLSPEIIAGREEPPQPSYRPLPKPSLAITEH